LKIWPRMDCSVELILILELIGILEFDQGRGLIYSSDDLEDDQTIILSSASSVLSSDLLLL
jgi:hypothetical protein